MPGCGVLLDCRDLLAGSGVDQTKAAVLLIRNEPTPNSLAIACMLTKDAAAALDACWHFPAAPHTRYVPIDLDALDRIIAEDLNL